MLITNESKTCDIYFYRDRRHGENLVSEQLSLIMEAAEVVTAAAVDGGLSEGKSYVSTYSKEYPVQDDLVMYKLFQQARDNGHVGEIVNLETGECTSTTQLLDQVRLLYFIVYPL